MVDFSTTISLFSFAEIPIISVIPFIGVICDNNQSENKTKNIKNVYYSVLILVINHNILLKNSLVLFCCDRSNICSAVPSSIILPLSTTTILSATSLANPIS